MDIEVKNSIKPIDYNKSMKILNKRVEDVYLGKKIEFLWILEHKTVYTAGTSSTENDLLDKSIKVIKTKRGGKHTLHSPGQKVIYFVLNLNNRGKDLRKFVKKIEKCIMLILSDYNIKSYADRKNIGIWVYNNNKTMKIASIGVKIKRWIAYHGFSLNVKNDLTMFNKIIPCGIKNKKITSLKKLGVKNFDKIDKIIAKRFLNIFHQEF